MKFKNFLSKLKNNPHSQDSHQSLNTEIQENNIDISIFQEKDYIKVCVADYYKIQDYVKKMDEIDHIGVDKLINNTIFWNSKKQSANKGDYFIFEHNEKLYNILVNSDVIKIDERTPIEKEILNKVITFDINSQTYSYFRCKHDENRSSYDIKYFNPKGVPAFELPENEFSKDFNEIMKNLNTFPNIKNIINLKSLQNMVKEQSQENTLSR